MSCPWLSTIQIQLNTSQDRNSLLLLLNKCNCYSVFHSKLLCASEPPSAVPEAGAFHSKLSPAPSTVFHYESLKKSLSILVVLWVTFSNFAKFFSEEWALSKMKMSSFLELS